MALSGRRRPAHFLGILQKRLSDSMMEMKYGSEKMDLRRHRAKRFSPISRAVERRAQRYGFMGKSEIITKRATKSRFSIQENHSLRQSPSACCSAYFI
jgi:hypothetical protein